MSAYLINQFYFAAAVSVQRILLLGGLFLYCFKHFPYIKRWLNDYRKHNAFTVAICIFVFWILIVIGTPFISGTGDYSYVSYSITFVSWFLYLFAISIRLRKKHPAEDTCELFMRIFILCMCLYVVSTIVILILPSLRQIILSTVDQSYNNLMLLEREKYYTRIGWAGFTGYSTSLKCTVAICFQLFFICKNIRNGKKISFGNIVAFLLLMLGNVFYARTGMLISIVCVLVAVFSIAVILNKFQTFAKYAVLALILGFIGVYAINSYSGENVVMNWMFEMFLNDSGSRYGSISASIIFNQMLFKINPSTLIHGDGYYTSPSGGYYMATDLGFMRLLLYFGIPGTAIIYTLYFYILRKIRIIGTNKAYIVLALLLFITFLGFEFKGESIVILVPLAFILLLIIDSNHSSEEG